jgi:hypothetical protein
MDKSSPNPTGRHAGPDATEVRELIQQAVGDALRPGRDRGKEIGEAAGVVVAQVNPEATLGLRFPLAEHHIREEIAKRIGTRWLKALKGQTALDEQLVARLAGDVSSVVGPTRSTAERMMAALGKPESLGPTSLPLLPPAGREAFIEAMIQREFTPEKAWPQGQPVKPWPSK